MDAVYLDNNATTMPAPEVADAVADAMRRLWANPSSVHRFGQLARQSVELARQSVATLIGARPRDLVFTSGGTESNNLAIRGLLDAAVHPVLITTRIEHSAVREPAEALAAQGRTVAYVEVGRAGLVPVDAVHEALRQHATAGATVLLSIQWANNETGAIQPIGSIAATVQQVRAALGAAGQRAKLLFHVDGTQAVGKLPVDVGAAGIDLMTLAAHKLHGPKGVGALWKRAGVRLVVQQRGGPQEREMRGGTENTAGITGFGVAAGLAADFLADEQAVARVRAMRDRLERSVGEALPQTVVNGRGAPRLFNTANLGFPGLEAEAILMGLSERGICASAGAACSSGSLEPSPVLRAMGVPEPVAHGSIRFSLSRYTAGVDIGRAIQGVVEVVGRLMRTMPV